MLLRSIRQFSAHRAGRRIPRKITKQIPISLRRELSTKPQKNAPPEPKSTGKPPESSGSFPKVVFGSVLIGAAVMAAYQTGYLDQYIGRKDQQDSLNLVKDEVENKDDKDIQKLVDQFVNGEELDDASEKDVTEKDASEKIETQSDHPIVEALSNSQGDVQPQVQEKPKTNPEEVAIKEKDVTDLPQSSMTSEDHISNSGTASEGSVEVKSAEENINMGSNEEVQTSPVSIETSNAEKESEAKEAPPVQFTVEEREEDAIVKDVEEPSSLLEAYQLGDKAGDNETSLHRHGGHDNNALSKEKEALSNALEELDDGYITKDGKLVLDFLQAIHAAESRQAELDARLYMEEKRALKEKYEKELKDAAVREMMLAEEAAMLDKELKRERTKAAAALKSLQEKLEEKYKTELEQLEHEAEFKLNKVEELAKAELAAKIASEKATQIEKIAEANLNINALCMAFYARSEEARRSHSAHKLALGALALEDALSKGLPIQSEIMALRNYLEGIDKDSILDLVLSSLPEETRNSGTDTLLQLDQKFDALKGTLRHFSLIPPGGGGVLTHSLAHVASWLKVKEASQSGDGIESLINKVESCLAEGKIAEAADVLEEGVQGSQASEIVGDWVKRARNRAITEQALTLLQSYATSISLT
ncbi:MICOS complex subunit MIC60, mitochondrial [Cannabis sativa]|uniref:MICOS complex subunit MIC60, mitochondrial n=1 Tax=Cannabis sativa TaxID=3483 RepID=UPI0029CA6331|nr:MICOS complex subunit MIC60, mitochondrial [Cannabis sativa]